MANVITTYPSLKGKHLLYSSHFQKLEILGSEIWIKRPGPRGNFFQSPPEHVSRAQMEFLSSPPPQGTWDEGPTVRTGLRCTAVPAASTHPVPAFPLCRLMPAPGNSPDGKSLVPTLGLNSPSLKQGRALGLINLLGVWLSR